MGEEEWVMIGLNHLGWTHDSESFICNMYLLSQNVLITYFSGAIGLLTVDHIFFLKEKKDIVLKWFFK